MEESRSAEAVEGHFHFHHSGFLDLGGIPPGKQFVVLLHVHNYSKEDMQIDVLAREFVTKGITITTIPGKKLY